MIEEELFADIDDYIVWKKEWQGMPEFIQEDAMPMKQIIINFACYEDVEDFGKLLNQKVSIETRSLWYPKQNREKPINYAYTGKAVEPKYPFYIISKGRYDVGTTRKAFDEMKLSYLIVVEEQEYEKYAQYIDKSKLLILPKKYLEEYDTFSKTGEGNSTGPGAARNYCWDHSISCGASKHWVFDDNISDFYRLNNNRKLRVKTSSIFRAMEDFIDRYTNIAIAGLNYSCFAKERQKLPPYILNTRIYSMLLIDNSISYRWRGRYNEDTDLSLRVLKDGYCTVQFNAFLGDKAFTQTMKGGNTEEFYEKEGTLNKSKMLVEMHPDVTELVWKFNRWHHKVYYNGFKKNKLIKKIDAVVREGVEDYNMILQKIYTNS